MNYNKNLLNELRIFVISDKEVEITDERLCKAITLNENLRSLGYQLRPKDIIRMAGNDSLDTMWNDFQNLVVKDIKAKPMYPDFPNQVMAIDEAQFRLHQICHYFSTYGIEYLFGVDVKQGWLPDVEDTEKTESDATLIEAKTIGLISESERFIVPTKKILSKRERMSIPETEIVMEAVPHLSKEELASLEVPFKENLIEIFHHVMDSDMNSDIKVNVLSSVCQHTGDVWKCLEFYIGKYKRYKLSTSEKRTIVKIFESYPVEDFRANLILSNKSARRIITLLEFLSYNSFSKSHTHKKAVYDLRNNNLKSWNSMTRYLIDSKDSSTIAFIGKRPGILLRMVNELLIKGFDAEEIKSTLIENASSLSMQTLVNVITFFEFDEDRDENVVEKIKDIFYSVMDEKMSKMETPLKNKKVFLGEKNVLLDKSVFGKSEEGGYIRSGMAIKIPESIQNLRFFCYWNDKKRIDIDLHAHGKTVEDKPVHIGWNDSFRRISDDGQPEVIFSGDITHSNAAEYIDIAMNSKGIKYMSFDIQSFTGVPFSNIETVYTGIMAVNARGEKVKLYDPKNCYFTHNLKGKHTNMLYGIIDVQNRVLYTNSQFTQRDVKMEGTENPFLCDFTIMKYVERLMKHQNAEFVDKAEDADIVMTALKPETENGISLIDENFFMEY